MRRGESGIGVSNARSTMAQIAPALLTADAPWRAQSPKPASPVRVRLIQLYPKTSAAHACSVTLALHGAAIAHNLQCLLTSLDPEGPHQLRIALRRTRVALKVFEPVMRAKVNARLVETARALGHIAGELRDADVLIDEIIAPAAREETGLMSALTAWRQEVRGRVRARLLAANAAALAADFAHAAGAPNWLKADALRADNTFAALIATAEQAFWEKAEPLAARMADLSHLELHQLRKAVKAMRYGDELAASAGLGGEVVPRLKRIQDALGYANDTVALEQFKPPVFSEADAFERVCARLIAERKGAVADAITSAMREWRALKPPVAATN